MYSLSNFPLGMFVAEERAVERFFQAFVANFAKLSGRYSQFGKCPWQRQSTGRPNRKFKILK